MGTLIVAVDSGVDVSSESGDRATAPPDGAPVARSETLESQRKSGLRATAPPFFLMKESENRGGRGGVREFFERGVVGRVVVGGEGRTLVARRGGAKHDFAWDSNETKLWWRATRRRATTAIRGLPVRSCVPRRLILHPGLLSWSYSPFRWLRGAVAEVRMGA